MTTYKELRAINVNEFTEKKGNLTYLSWTWAVDTLLQNDPEATWEFPEPKYFGETVMVFCNVTALGKTMRMQLPVMDNRNNAIPNPDARKISDATMRCLAKCIACFGIGLYIFAGEDLPSVDSETLAANHVDAIQAATTLDELRTVYVSAVTAVGSDGVAKKILESAKDKRKAELEAK
jgi:hypothetical protein